MTEIKRKRKSCMALPAGMIALGLSVFGTEILGFHAWAAENESAENVEVMKDMEKETEENEDGGSESGWCMNYGKWCYFLEDGRLNTEDLIVDNTVYEFSRDGVLKFARCLEDTGGGAYEVVCYDEAEQLLFDYLNDEKKDLFFEEYDEREDDYDGNGFYDRYAAFRMDARLNQIAQHRLEAAMEFGYTKDTVSGEGTLSEYLKLIGYRENATCMELYIRSSEDTDEAWDKIYEKTEEKQESKEDKKYSLTYYRTLGMAHKETDGKQYFLLVLMR